MPTVFVRNAHGGINCTFDKEPDRCPICRNGIQPIDSGYVYLQEPNKAVLEQVYRCPVSHCQRVFIARYIRNPHSGNYLLSACVPFELINYVPPDELKKISPDFCAIYNEAQKAEQHGLTLVSGPGYRKALEFLVKDYLTLLQTTEEAKKEIAESPLAACIKKYVTDGRMRTTAERAAWLGNDEVHYVRKWEDKDLQDLKNLIELTRYWILSEHLTKAAAVEMPDGRK